MDSLLQVALHAIPISNGYAFTHEAFRPFSDNAGFARDDNRGDLDVGCRESEVLTPLRGALERSNQIGGPNTGLAKNGIQVLGWQDLELNAKARFYEPKEISRDTGPFAIFREAGMAGNCLPVPRGLARRCC